MFELIQEEEKLNILITFKKDFKKVSIKFLKKTKKQKTPLVPGSVTDEFFQTLKEQLFPVI